MNEPPVCARCEDEYFLRDGMEPTKYCDPCAHERVAELEALLEKLGVTGKLSQHSEPAKEGK